VIIKIGIYFAYYNLVYSFIDELLDKGKPFERAGRKAAGLSSDIEE